jgi:hypothetical protein
MVPKMKGENEMSKQHTEHWLTRVAFEHYAARHAWAHREYFEGKRFAYAEMLAAMLNISWGEADDMLIATYEAAQPKETPQ